jgi:hypothetical protein
MALVALLGPNQGTGAEPVAAQHHRRVTHRVLVARGGRVELLRVDCVCVHT